MIIPTKPIRPPPTRMENSTQKLAIPVVSPRILGPITFPSSCCRASMKIRKYIHCIGFTISISSADGIAPINGPKNGMIFVIPTIQLISSGYSQPNSVMLIKQSTPIIAESISLPLMNPPKVLFVYCADKNFFRFFFTESCKNKFLCLCREFIFNIQEICTHNYSDEEIFQ